MQPLAKCRNDFGLNHRLNNGRRGQRNSADADQHNNDCKPSAGEAVGWQVTIPDRGQSLHGDIKAVAKRPAFNQTESDRAENECNSERDNRVANAEKGAESMDHGERHYKVLGFGSFDVFFVPQPLRLGRRGLLSAWPLVHQIRSNGLKAKTNIDTTLTEAKM